MEGLVLPELEGGSLLNIPSTILKLFGLPPLKKTLPGKYYRSGLGAGKIALFLIDGFGEWLFENEASKYPIFQKLSRYKASITTIFPSTTAAVLGCLNSGLSVLEHGLPEWNVYFRELGCVVQTLPFKPANPADFEKIINPPDDLLFNQKSIYQMLAEVGVESSAVLGQDYKESFYNEKAFIGSEIVGYTQEDFVEVICNQLRLPGPRYLYIHYTFIDNAEHKAGPHSDEVKKEVEILARLLEQLVAEAGDFCLMLTADHGQIATDPERTIYLDSFRGFENTLEKGPSGEAIPPAGAPRDVFISSEQIDEAVLFLTDKLSDKADIFKTDELIEKGWFGRGSMHKEFKERIGNILILPRGNNLVWYHYVPDLNYKLLGSHGGLTKEEMLIPFVCCKVSDLS